MEHSASRFFNFWKIRVRAKTAGKDGSKYTLLTGGSSYIRQVVKLDPLVVKRILYLNLKNGVNLFYLWAPSILV